MNSEIIAHTRRSFLRNMALGSAATLSGSLIGCVTTTTKGPLVWLDMDQKELDDAYSQFIYAPNIGQVIDRYGSSSAIVRSRLGEPLKFGFTPLDDALGMDMAEVLPEQPESLHWHRIMNEIQIALHASPVNVRRRQNGQHTRQSRGGFYY